MNGVPRSQPVHAARNRSHLSLVCARLIFPHLAAVWALAGCGEANSPAGGHPAPTQDASPSCQPTDWRCAPESPTDLAAFGGHTSLAVAPDGSVAVALHDAGAGALVVGRADPGEPLRTVSIDAGATRADASKTTGRHTATAFDLTGRQHVVYYSAAGPGLRWVALDGLQPAQEGWVEVGNSKLAAPSLAVEADGTLHLSYYDGERGQLRYARRPPSGEWTAETVPAPPCLLACGATADWGRFSSIGLSGSTPLIAFYDRAEGNLALARGLPSGWAVDVLDGRDTNGAVDTSDRGRWPSLRVNSDGSVAVAYQDAGTGSLWYVSSPKGEIIRELVDDGARPDPVHGARWDGAVGAFAQLLTTPEGLPAIYYLDSTAVRVRRTLRTDAGWQSPETISDKPAGLWLRAAATPSGDHIICAETWEESAEGLRRRLDWWIR